MSLQEKLREEREDGWKEGLEEGRIREAIHIFRDYMGMDDQELLKNLTAEFSLTGEEAADWITQIRKAQ